MNFHESEQILYLQYFFIGYVIPRSHQFLENK